MRPVPALMSLPGGRQPARRGTAYDGLPGCAAVSGTGRPLTQPPGRPAAWALFLADLDHRIQTVGESFRLHNKTPPPPQNRSIERDRDVICEVLFFKQKKICSCHLSFGTFV